MSQLASSTTNPDPRPGPSLMWSNPFFLAWLLAVLTALVFWPAIHCEFVDYDDGVYVTDNPQVMKGLGWGGIEYAFRSVEGGSWMPLTWLSLMLDFTLYGDNPTGFHLTNILFHSANAGLLLLLLTRLTGRLWLSTLVAAMFALHPLRTESVVWVAERKDVLSVFWWILGLTAYLRHVTERTGRSLKSKVFYILLCLAFGLMTKPMLVTFPFTLLLLDFWPLKQLGGTWPELRKSIWLQFWRKLPFFLLVLAACILTLRTQGQAGARSHRQTTFLERGWQVTSNYAFYVQKFFAPVQRTVIYPESKLPPVVAGGVVLALGAFTVCVVLRAFQQPWLVVGWLWFLGTLAPVIGLVRVGSVEVSDRYSYFPSIGLSLLIVWGVAELVRRNIPARRMTTILALVIVGGFAWLTRADLKRWQDSESLFAAASQVAPHKIALNNLAYFLVKRGEYARAIEACTQALSLDPNYGPSYGNRALAHAWANDYEQSKRDYDQAVALGTRPIQPTRLRNSLLGAPAATPTRNDPDEAWHLFAGVSGLEPRSAGSYRDRGDIRVKVGDIKGGIDDYTKAIALAPEDDTAHTRRGNAYVRLKDWTNALTDMNRAVELSRTNAMSFQNRAVALYHLGRLDEAWVDVKQCYKLGGKPHASFLDALTQAALVPSREAK